MISCKQAYQVSRIDVFQQRYGLIFPLTGFLAGWLSLELLQQGNHLAVYFASAVIAGWLWLYVRPQNLQNYLQIGHVRSSAPGDIPVHNDVRSIQQCILYFSLPFLIQATNPADAGQLLVTGFVLLAALISTSDRLYLHVLAKNPITLLAFHSLCTFVAALVVLPTAIHVPAEHNFAIAIGCVLLWLVVAVPLNFSQNAISMRMFGLAILFPLAVWGAQEHIPAAGITVERSVVTSAVKNHEPRDELSVVLPSQLAGGLYVHAAISAPLGVSRNVIFNWQHDDYSESMESTMLGAPETGFRTYAFKRHFMEKPQGLWTVDILTPQGQLLERVNFEVQGMRTGTLHSAGRGGYDRLPVVTLNAAY